MSEVELFLRSSSCGCEFVNHRLHVVPSEVAVDDDELLPRAVCNGKGIGQGPYWRGHSHAVMASVSSPNLDVGEHKCNNDGQDESSQ